MKNNRIIITGGAGFIGRFLANKLASEGWDKIIIIDRRQPQSYYKKFYQGNFWDQRILSQVIKRNDIVIHLACTTVPATSELNREKDVKDNIVGTLRLLAVCAEKKIKQFVFVSSGGTVYGDIGRKPAKETDCPNPFSSHGVMKLAIEKYIQVFQHIYGLNFLIVRGGNPYGGEPDWRRQQGVIDIFLKRIISQQPIEIWGDGNVVRDYIYIDDFVNFFVFALKKEVKNEIFNVASGKGHSLKDILQIIKKIAKKDFVVKYKSQRSFDLDYNVLNISKAKRRLGWRPLVSLPSGIEHLYTELKNKHN